MIFTIMCNGGHQCPGWTEEEVHTFSTSFRSLRLAMGAITSFAPRAAALRSFCVARLSISRPSLCATHRPGHTQQRLHVDAGLNPVG